MGPTAPRRNPRLGIAAGAMGSCKANIILL